MVNFEIERPPLQKSYFKPVVDLCHTTGEKVAQATRDAFMRLKKYALLPTEVLSNLATLSYVTGTLTENPELIQATAVGSILFGAQIMYLAGSELLSLLQAEELDVGAISEQLLRLLSGAMWITNGIFSLLMWSVKSLTKHIPTLGIVAATLDLLADGQKIWNLLSEEQTNWKEIGKVTLSMTANVCMLMAGIFILATLANPYSGPAIIALSLIAALIPLTIAFVDYCAYKNSELPS